MLTGIYTYASAVGVNNYYKMADSVAAQTSAYKKRVSDGNGYTKEKNNQKIKNIEEDARQKPKGQEYSRANKTL